MINKHVCNVSTRGLDSLYNVVVDRNLYLVYTCCPQHWYSIWHK